EVLEVVVGLAEDAEGRRARGVGVDHVQDRFLCWVRQIVGDHFVGIARVRVVGRDSGGVLLQLPNRSRRGGRVSRYVELRRGVVLQSERSGVALLGGDQSGEVAAELAERSGRVDTRNIRGDCETDDLGSVAAGRGRLNRATDVAGRL